ncbi:MAG: ABC transporter ATP-binding protein [Allgaiera sp.]|jgi:branched-chain amino acid transport system ATP-binding protein|nr:ABC transporter ATP-binding protein [Allgaiera sp.]
MLDVTDLHAYYGKSHILQGVTLSVGDNEVVSLLGRNGVGRSTTTMAIMGMVSAHGSVRLRGRELIGLPPHEVARQGIGIVPESRAIFPTLTVRENLLIGTKTKGQAGRWSEEATFEMFPNLKERADTAAGVLSGGEQQMLSICRTLMGNPDLVMIDEPTEGLAPQMVEQVGRLLTAIAAQGVSILLVEQKLQIAMRVSHRVLVMGHGRIVFTGTPAELTADEAIRREWLEV